MRKSALFAATLLAVLSVAAVMIVEAQNRRGGEVEIRINAKRHENGSTEFAVQQRDGAGWSERIAPSGRFLPAQPPIDRWLNSTPVTVMTEADDELSDFTDTDDNQPTQAPAPPRGWTPLPDTSGDVPIYLDYSVERNPIDDTLTTVVSTRASSGSFGLEYIELSMTCEDGRFNLVIDDDNLHFDDLPAEVTLRPIGGEPTTYSWPRFRGAASGFSPDDDQAFVRTLRSVSRIAVQLQDSSATSAEIVDLAGFFQTPAQPNLDHCGRAAPSGVALLGDTGGENDINVRYNVSADLSDAELTTVIEVRGSDDDSFSSSRLYLVCDRGRFDVVFGLSGISSSSTPTTVLRIDHGPEERYRWSNIRGVEDGISPDDDFSFLQRLRSAASIEIGLASGTGVSDVTFRLPSLLDTAAQANIDHCGRY